MVRESRGSYAVSDRFVCFSFIVIGTQIRFHETHRNFKYFIAIIYLCIKLNHFRWIYIGDLLPSTYTGLEQSRLLQATDVHVIFLQALANGLMRVRLQGPISRINLATPLIDGMVVSRRVLGILVRQTALNMGRRKRLDNDRYNNFNKKDIYFCNIFFNYILC